MNGPAELILADGKTFVGKSYGATGERMGKLVICSSPTVYEELLTSESSEDFILVFTTPHVGNTGLSGDGAVQAAGVVIRDPALRASHFSAKLELEDHLKACGTVGICGIDTRALVRLARGKNLWAKIVSGSRLFDFEGE